MPEFTFWANATRQSWRARLPQNRGSPIEVAEATPHQRRGQVRSAPVDAQGQKFPQCPWLKRVFLGGPRAGASGARVRATAPNSPEAAQATTLIVPSISSWPSPQKTSQ